MFLHFSSAEICTKSFSRAGAARRTTGAIVIEDPETRAALSKLLYEVYEKLERGVNNPIARFFIGKKIGKKTLSTLLDFVMPKMRWYIRWHREGTSDEILRDCPVLMLFHCPVNEPMGADNCNIAAFHAILMAETQGIGTCLNHLIPPACNKSSEIRKLLELPDDREIQASITMGYPRYQFKRVPPRRLAEVRYLR